jgi:hypothetical protein
MQEVGSESVQPSARERLIGSVSERPIERPGLPGIFEATILSKRVRIPPSTYIRAMHPKTGIRASREAIQKTLSAGWIGQLKIHGHRAQIHIPADPKLPVLAYARHGGLHKKLLPDEMVAEIRRVFAPERGWNVIDTEWLKPEGKLFVFDLLRKDGKILSGLTYPERWKLLPKHFISPHMSILPLLTTLEKCLEAMANPDEHIEGLVFKASTRTGFADTSIIRCRKVAKAG